MTLPCIEQMIFLLIISSSECPENCSEGKRHFKDTVCITRTSFYYETKAWEANVSVSCCTSSQTSTALSRNLGSWHTLFRTPVSIRILAVSIGEDACALRVSLTQEDPPRRGIEASAKLTAKF